MLTRDANRVCRVLLAEDCYEDIAVFKRVVNRNQSRFELEIVMDGEEDILFLKKANPWNDAWISQ